MTNVAFWYRYLQVLILKRIVYNETRELSRYVYRIKLQKLVM